MFLIHHGPHPFHQYGRIPHRPCGGIHGQIEVRAQINKPHSELVEQNPVGSQEISTPPPLQVVKPSNASSPDLIVIGQIQILRHIDRMVLVEQ